MRRSASMVAFSTLCGLFVPSVLVRMSWMPTASSTGRTAPPAMTPVPGTAGLRNTRPAPKWPAISHGIVVSLSGTKIRSFFACSTALRIASGTSWALPRPTPTWPRPSPTTTSAVNENRRPPLTTLATRLMETTRSFSSSTLGSILASATRFSLGRRGLRPPLDSPANTRERAAAPSRLPLTGEGGFAPLSTPPRTRGATGRLENEPAGASRVGKRLHAPVVHIAAAIEYHALDSLRLRLLGQELSNEFGGGDVAPGGLARTEHLAPTVHGQERSPRVVVYELRVDVVQAAEHGQPRPRLGAAQESAEPPMPDVPRRAPLLRDHLAPAPAFLPTFRRITSFAYLMPLPLYGSGFRSARSFAAVWPRSALSAPRSVMDTWRSISAVTPSGSGKITGCE